MNKKGIALILSFMVIVVLTVLSAAIISRSISERQIVQRYIESTQAFWLAEAGVARAIEQLLVTDPIGPINITVGGKQGTYTTTTVPVTGYTSRYEIISTGTVGNIQRRIKVIVELSLSSNAGSITKAVETTGGLSITGNVVIDPTGSYVTNSELTFEDIFGATKDAVKAKATRIYTDPPTNQQPVDGITWVDLSGETRATAKKYVISSDWSGSGILVVDGHRNADTEDITALEISGGWNFTGVIWVVGKLRISGTANITGAVFAETSVDVDSTITGNVTLSFDSNTVLDTFGLFGFLVKSWQEIKI